MMTKNKRKKVLIGLGGGGFTWESFVLVKKIGPRYDYIYVILKQFGEVQKMPLPGKVYKVTSPTLIGQNILQKSSSFLKSFVEALIVILKVKPDVIINIGTSLAIPLSFWGKILKRKVIFIQCITRVNTFSLTDKIIYKLKLADRFYTQWPYLSKKFGLIYKGRLI